MSPSSAPAYVQASFDELGEPLREVTFVVVDLETTGGSAATSAITEIGAVRVRAGEVLGEFQTLVNPGAGIPPFIAVLTGITDAMVATAPRLGAVLPAFLEFARGSVLVAHNAPFDLGFLRAGCAQLGVQWPGFRHVDTAILARRALTRDESPDCRLATLARLFRAHTQPCHRALSDARATVDVLHGLLERVGNLGVQSLDELQTFTHQVSLAQRRKRHLAEHLPHAPGCYLFRDGQGRPLYVGKSKDLRTRVRNYFVSSETRSRMREMVGLAERVDAVVCAHALEAEVRELRLIAEHKPRYNRRSKFPERGVYLKLTIEAFPRLSVVRAVRDDGATYLGPFGSRVTAEMAMTAVHEAVPLRQCTRQLSIHRTSAACILAEIGRCGAPCEHEESVQEYAVHAEAFTAAVTGDPGRVVEPLLRRITRLSAAQRYEDATATRNRLMAFLRSCIRLQRLRALTDIAALVAAHPSGSGGWELSVIRYGRLVAAGVVPAAADPRPYIDALRATAESVARGPGPAPCATAEESECLLRWLEQPATRIVAIDGCWASPVAGAARWQGWLTRAAERDGVDPFADRRGLRIEARPARASA
ncbi:MAG: DEDD exonuclease domain-containing protein [Actinomycetota bacterium]|nr:DEDD exonuclease domain-containing protein [Actinomycetota bacterium]